MMPIDPPDEMGEDTGCVDCGEECGGGVCAECAEARNRVLAREELSCVACRSCAEPIACGDYCPACVSDMEKEARAKDVERARTFAFHVLDEYEMRDRADRRMAENSLAAAVDDAVSKWFEERGMDRASRRRDK